MTEINTFVTHLECSLTGKKYEKDTIHTLSEAGKPLLVKYDLEALAKHVSKQTIKASSKNGFWRYENFLPVTKSENQISLGEVITPLIPLNRSSEVLGASNGKIIVKDEGRLPTGSFKARGLCLAVSMAKELGIKHLAIPTNGNAGAAMAAYATHAGIKTTVFCPDDTPTVNVAEIKQQGGDVYLIDGLINDCGRIVGEGKEAVGWFDVSTLKEPYRIEGKKTMGMELAEQMGWQLPDVIFYPTGGGTGMIGMWKAFHELKAMGWISGKLPRMVVVQAKTCAPIVRAWENKQTTAAPWENAQTVAAGIRVPVAIGDFLILQAVNESDGFAVSVSDDDIMRMRDDIADKDGLLLCPEGAATAVACKIALEKGWIDKSDTAVLYNCATGLKYPMTSSFKRLDRGAIDYDRF